MFSRSLPRKKKLKAKTYLFSRSPSHLFELTFQSACKVYWPVKLGPNVSIFIRFINCNIDSRGPIFTNNEYFRFSSKQVKIFMSVLTLQRGVRAGRVNDIISDAARFSFFFSKISSLSSVPTRPLVMPRFVCSCSLLGDVLTGRFQCHFNCASCNVSWYCLCFYQAILGDFYVTSRELTSNIY